MFAKKTIPTLVSAIALLAFLFGACQTQSAATPSPLSQAPTDPPAPEATVDCGSDIHASSTADIVGVWAGVSVASAGKANLEFKADGFYTIKLAAPTASAGVSKGFVVDSGSFRFDGAQLKFENASCQNAKGDLFACIGIYEACVIKQGDQLTQLKLIVIDDQFTGRRLGLTPDTPLSIVQP